MSPIKPPRPPPGRFLPTERAAKIISRAEHSRCYAAQMGVVVGVLYLRRKGKEKKSKKGNDLKSDPLNGLGGSY